MHHSTERILTSHVGSLPRPAELLALYRSGATGDALNGPLRDAVAAVVARQRAIGIDIVNDGEYGKPSSDEIDYSGFMYYAYQRLSGYEMREVPLLRALGTGKEFEDFAEYYAAELGLHASDPDATAAVGVNVGEIAYVGAEDTNRDVENLLAALPDHTTGDAFMTSMAHGTVIYELPSEHYATTAELDAAQAEAMREEFRLIADAGLILQLDDPWLADAFGTVYARDNDLAGFRRWAEEHIELVNHAIRGIPPERIRHHICWGSWKGPHNADVPLAEIIGLLLKLNVGLYSVEAANPMHEHEWQVWRDVDLPDGKLVMPGVVSHKTNVLEHPEVVAERITHYAEAVGRENVIAGTDCGMGGRIHPQIAWAKLEALTQGAELASRRLWAA